jgi:hypothetical protein
MRWLNWRYPTLALAALLVCGGPTFAQGAPVKNDARELASFGTLKAPVADAAREQARNWLASTGSKLEGATLQAFDAVWQSDRPVFDKVTETLILGDENARKLLAEARNPSGAAPTQAPVLIRDAKQDAFFRANFALAYAKALAGRRVYEEALETLKAVKPEQVADPSAYLFHRAVAEYSLLLKPEAQETIARLLDDVADAPERHKMVAALMHFDMLTWRDKDLGWIARKMDNIERRLEMARGGQTTQKMQKEVVARLDELIKQLENQQNQSSSSNGGSCPNGGQQPGNGGSNNPSAPMQDSNIATNPGPGQVDPKRLKEVAEVWGKLPDRERAQAIQGLTKDMPPRQRQLIEDYFKRLAQEPTAGK